MVIQLNRLTHSLFSNEEAVTYAEKATPVYKEAFGNDPFLQGVTTDTQERKFTLRDFLNHSVASEFTAEVRSSDESREDGMISIKDQLSSNIRRSKKKPELASNSTKLLAIIETKCPDFSRTNDTEQTVKLDALQAELALPENVALVQAVGVEEIIGDLFEFNDAFKSSHNQRTAGNAKENPKSKVNRYSLLKTVHLMHLCLDYLLEKEPDVMAPFANEINGINTEIMARVHARITREKNNAATAEMATGTTAS